MEERRKRNQLWRRASKMCLFCRESWREMNHFNWKLWFTPLSLSSHPCLAFSLAVWDRDYSHFWSQHLTFHTTPSTGPDTWICCPAIGPRHPSASLSIALWAVLTTRRALMICLRFGAFTCDFQKRVGDWIGKFGIRSREGLGGHLAHECPQVDWGHWGTARQHPTHMCMTLPGFIHAATATIIISTDSHPFDGAPHTSNLLCFPALLSSSLWNKLDQDSYGHGWQKPSTS